MRKRQTKADLLRSFGIPEEKIRAGGPSWIRYKSPLEKGIYWYFFSLHIRKRDVERYGRCISCDRPIEIDTCDAGHFMPARDCGKDLLFDELNVNAECSGCNGFDETHLLGYAEGLDRRYGAGTAAMLRLRRQVVKATEVPIKDWSRLQYAEKIRQLTKESF